MKNWRTSLAGAVAAASMIGFSDTGLEPPWPKVLMIICAVALGALGWHSVDCKTCPGVSLRQAAGLAVVLLVVVLAGCTLSALRVKLSSPAFGSLDVGLGGGSIGKGSTNILLIETNAPTPLSATATNLPMK